MTDREVRLEERVLEEGWAHRPEQKTRVSKTKLRGQREQAGREARPDSGQGGRNPAGGILDHVDPTAPRHQGSSQGGF